jgi:hypothetical protein
VPAPSRNTIQPSPDQRPERDGGNGALLAGSADNAWGYSVAAAKAPDIAGDALLPGSGKATALME